MVGTTSESDLVSLKADTDIDTDQLWADRDMGQPRADTNMGQPWPDTCKSTATTGRTQGCVFWMGK